MNIKDRMKEIPGVESAIWEARTNRLVVFYSIPQISRDAIKVRVMGAIGEAGLQRAVETVTFIGSGELS